MTEITVRAHCVVERAAMCCGRGQTTDESEASHGAEQLPLKLLHGLDAFTARGLQDKSFVIWTNHIADGPSHSMKNVPHIIWGNGGGYLKQGQFIDAGNVTNNKLFNTLITTAIRDKSTAPINFGMGTGTGEIAGIKA